MSFRKSTLKNKTTLDQCTDRQIRALDAAIEWQKSSNKSQIEIAKKYKGISDVDISRMANHADHLIERRKQVLANKGMESKNGKIETKPFEVDSKDSDYTRVPLERSEVEEAVRRYVEREVFRVDCEVMGLEYSEGKCTVTVDLDLGSGNEGRP